ncbi:hypothetical protein AHEVV1_008 [Adoxophyes honmai entomopoxvirus 'L' virophage 1]|nr:hypothetical protein AHEVV1_008 [Adoxophyes honmai entomopoxvirus 'L' virophage 1]
MYILKNKKTHEFVVSKYRFWKDHECIPLKRLKEEEIYFKPNPEIMKLLSKNYYVHFRGYIPIKLHDTRIPHLEKYKATESVSKEEHQKTGYKKSVISDSEKYKKKENESYMDFNKRFEKMIQDEEKEYNYIKNNELVKGIKT